MMNHRSTQTDNQEAQRCRRRKGFAPVAFTESETAKGSLVLLLKPSDGRAAMRLCSILCAVFLLLSQALCGHHRGGSMIIRNPDIDASWYTGRGIRPVGRFGRKVARRNEHLAFITARVYRPTADSENNV